MKVTKKQIAQELGLSQATVSQALNNKRNVSAETRRRVLEKAAQLGYIQDSAETAEKALRIHLLIFRKYTVSINESAFHKRMLTGIESEARERHISLSMSYFYKGYSFQDQCDALKFHEFDGMIILATDMEETDFRFFEKLPFPILILDNFFDTTRCDLVAIDNRAGIDRAYRFLQKKGHQRIGYFMSDLVLCNFTQRRLHYKELVSMHVDQEPFFLKITEGRSEPSEALKKRLEKHPELPSAFLTDNDVIAAAAVSLLRRYGYRVPEEVSIIGFDRIPSIKIKGNDLTTLDVDPAALGRLAIERMQQRLTHPEYDETITILYHPRLWDSPNGTVREYRSRTR